MKKLLFFSFVCSFVFLFNLNSVSASTGLEVTGGVDTDKDGLIDEAELLFGTSVSNSDSDGDSYKDGAEVVNNFDPKNNKGGKLKIIAGKEEDSIISGNSVKLLNSFGATKRLISREIAVSKNELLKLLKKNKNLKTNIAINFIAYGSKSTYNLSINDRYTLLVNHFTKYKKFPVTAQDWKNCLGLVKELKKVKPVVSVVKPIISTHKPFVVAGKKWNTVKEIPYPEEVKYESLFFDNETPYMSYQDVYNGGKATVMKFNGTKWETVGKPGFSEGPVWYTRLVFNNNIPYIVYDDFANNNKATVMKFNGVNWVNVGNSGFSVGRADNVSLIFDKQNIPYVSFIDCSNNKIEGNLKLTVMKFNGKTWEVVGNQKFTTGNAEDQSLVFNNNKLYIVYKDDGNLGKATVMSFNGKTWENVGNPGFSSGLAGKISLVFNDDNVPYVIFSNGPYVIDKFEDIEFSVMKFNGKTWENVGRPGLSKDLENKATLVFYDNIPYVSYVESGNVIVKSYNNSSWNEVGLFDVHAASCNFNLSFWGGLEEGCSINSFTFQEGVLTLKVVNGKIKIIKFSESVNDVVKPTVINEDNLIIDKNFDISKDWKLVDKTSFSEGKVDISVDEKTIADVKQIGSALELYFNEVGRYPDFIKTGESIISISSTNYLNTVPEPMLIKNEKCTKTEYIYTSLKNNQDYKLEYCLNNVWQNISAGVHFASPSGLGS